MTLTRLIAALALVTAVPVTMAQQPTLYLGSYGGSTEKLFKEKIIPAFEAKHGVKVVYVAGMRFGSYWLPQREWTTMPSEQHFRWVPVASRHSVVWCCR